MLKILDIEALSTVEALSTFEPGRVMFLQTFLHNLLPRDHAKSHAPLTSVR